MAANNNIKQLRFENSLQVLKRATNAARKPGKAAGTRMGVLDDWRGGDTKGRGETARLGKSLRDGR